MRAVCPKHGKRQKQNKQRGYSLLEAMVSTTISAILAGAALPAYEAYVARAQVTEAIVQMGGLKSQVVESVYMGTGFPAGQLSLPGSTNLVSEVSVLSSEECPDVGGFEARMSDQGPHSAIAGKTVRLWFNGNNTWSCTSGEDGSIDVRHLPVSCRQPSLTIDTSTCTLAVADDADLPDASDIDDSGPDPDFDDGDDWDDGDEDWGDSDDDGGKITICHKPGTPAEKTLSVGASAWGGHSGHGDTMGACP